MAKNKDQHVVPHKDGWAVKNQIARELQVFMIPNKKRLSKLENLQKIRKAKYLFMVRMVK